MNCAGAEFVITSGNLRQHFLELKVNTMEEGSQCTLSVTI